MDTREIRKLRNQSRGRIRARPSHETFSFSYSFSFSRLVSWVSGEKRKRSRIRKKRKAPRVLPCSGTGHRSESGTARTPKRGRFLYRSWNKPEIMGLGEAFPLASHSVASAPVIFLARRRWTNRRAEGRSSIPGSGGETVSSEAIQS